MSAQPDSESSDWHYDVVIANDRRSWTLGETEHYFIDLCPMIYNHRLVLTPKACTEVWDAGWCYRDRDTAMLAALLWVDPENTEPAGAIKRIGVWPV